MGVLTSPFHSVEKDRIGHRDIIGNGRFNRQRALRPFTKGLMHNHGGRNVKIIYIFRGILTGKLCLRSKRGEWGKNECINRDKR